MINLRDEILKALPIPNFFTWYTDNWSGSSWLMWAEEALKMEKEGSTDSQEDWYDDEYYEGQPHEDCPKCGRSYDHIDFDYQSCSKCGWDAENEKWTEAREPSEDDYLNGDADILTGRWY